VYKPIIKTREELLLLRENPFGLTRLPEEEIFHWFSLLEAGWTHDGDPKMPHAELTSGLCSSGFFDCLRVLKYVNLSEILAHQLALKLLDECMKDGGFPGVQWVLGSPMAAITFAHDVAKFTGVPINMFLEKDPSNSKRLLWNRMVIPEDEPILQVEELITTAHTTNEVERAVREGNVREGSPNPVTFAPYVGALVHRPPKMVEKYGDRKIVALISKEVWAGTPDQCPLCKAGSARVRPKQNWAKLTGKS